MRSPKNFNPMTTNQPIESPVTAARVGSSPLLGSFYYVAKVSVLRGDRKISAFMRNAGLGLNGVGVRETMTVTYKHGEEVDEARVLRAFAEMKRASDEQRTPFEIYSFDVVSLVRLSA